MYRLPYTLWSILASLALAGGPAVSALHAESVERLARKDAEEKKRSQHRDNGKISRESPSPTPGDLPSKSPNKTSSSFVAPSAAKPTDTDSSNLNHCLAAATDDLPKAALRDVGETPPSMVVLLAPHRSSDQAQAPPHPIDSIR